jgi:hypothetical protein
MVNVSQNNVNPTQGEKNINNAIIYRIYVIRVKYLTTIRK